MATVPSHPVSIIDNIGTFNIKTELLTQYESLKDEERLLIESIKTKLALMENPSHTGNREFIRREIDDASRRLHRVQTELADLIASGSIPTIRPAIPRWSHRVMEESPYVVTPRYAHFPEREVIYEEPPVHHFRERMEPRTTGGIEIGVVESRLHTDNHILNIFLDECKDPIFVSLINWIKKPVAEDSDLKYHYLAYLMTLPLLHEFSNLKWNIIRDEFFRACPEMMPNKDMVVKLAPSLAKMMSINIAR